MTVKGEELIPLGKIQSFLPMQVLSMGKNSYNCRYSYPLGKNWKTRKLALKVNFKGKYFLIKRKVENYD